MENKQELDGFYYVKIAVKTLKQFWYIFLASVIACLCVAYFINWYLQPVYEVGNVILIDGKQNANMPDPSQEFMKSFSIFNTESEINKEIQKIGSLELIFQALLNTSAEVSYFAITKEIKKVEMYDDSPFHIIINKAHLQPLSVNFEIKPKAGYKFNISVKESEKLVDFYNYQKNDIVSAGTFSLNKEYDFGDTIETPFCSFVVQLDQKKSKNFNPSAKYSFVFNNLSVLMYSYQKQLQIDQIGKDIQAISIKLKVKNPQKGIDFINALTRAYVQRNIDKKNLLADNAIKYIDKELATIEGALTTNESELQRFRSSNRMMEMKSLSDQAFKVAGDLETQKSELELRARYFDYISGNLEEDDGSSNILVPSSMGVNDPVLSGIIEEYLKLNTERNNLIQNKKTLSPYFNTLSNKVEVQKKTLLTNIQNLMKSNNVLLSSLNGRLRQENAKISLLPGTERGLVGIERKQSLNDEVFKYMLRKKAEAQIAKGSSLPDNDILEEAKLTQLSPVSPNKPINVLVAFIAGIFFPFVFFGAKSLMNDKVTDEQMLLSIAPLSIVGRICGKKNQKQVSVLTDSPKSPISESIRTVRTNIEYFLEGKRNQVILLSSSMSGEGKSFCSLNLAHSLSLAKRKVVLLDFDLRKPNQYQDFTTENKLGITSFLNGKSAIKDILIHTGSGNFDFIGAGDIPPNPAELIDSDFTGYLISKLKEEYDYVIIDTAPIGLVWETFILMKYADLKIFVVRENYTKKDQLESLIKKMENQKVENISWLLNGVDVKKTEYGKSNPYYTSN
jgi:tyrosine-protein kinase Etk/Wzc